MLFTIQIPADGAEAWEGPGMLTHQVRTVLTLGRQRDGT